MITTCPTCEKDFEVGADSMEEAEGATCDCPNCGIILIFDEGKVKDFNVHMNELDSRWPPDGQGTGAMYINEDDLV